ncbi:MFS transporter [Haloplanus sp. GCM10025708]|uniref:MFS transporter n=1 Tax=Haloferacaceae TaxID=1644056 RepID=UPI0036070B61
MSTRVVSLFEVAHPRRVLLLSGAHAINEFYSVALPPILPLLVADLSVSYAEAGFLVTVFFVMYTIFQLPVGFLADRTSKRALIVGGMVVLAGGMFLASFAESYLVLAASQVLAGIGGSTYHPAGMSLVSDIEGSETEGKAMGLHGLGGIVGTMLAPALVGGLAAVYDWRTALAGSAVVGVGYAVVFVALFRSSAETSAESGGSGGSDLSLRERLRESLSGFAKLSLTGWVAGLVVGKVLFSFQFGAVRTYTTSYVFARAGESASLSNVVFFVLLVGGAVASLWFGSLADRFDRAKLLAATFFVAGAFVGVTILLPPSVPFLLAWFFAVGVAVYATLPVINTLVSQYAQRESSGSLFGITQTASAVGSATAPVVFGAVATRYGIGVAFPSIAVVSVGGGLVLLVFAYRVFT